MQEEVKKERFFKKKKRRVQKPRENEIGDDKVDRVLSESYSNQKYLSINAETYFQADQHH